MTDGKSARDWFKEIEDQETTPSLRQTEGGVFGLDTVVEDFDEAEIERLRAIAEVIRSPERKGVRGAIALAGSAAQTKFQLYPVDCDFFERVHIVASSREEALATLASVMIETVGRVFSFPNLQFAEMKLGLHSKDSKRGDNTMKAGSPISWFLPDIDARSYAVEDADGNTFLIEMAEVVENPGFVKLDWIQADAEHDRIVAVSKVIDATWEDSEGTIVPLDGVLDAFYQEVYLDPESKPHVERLIDRAEPSGLREYIQQLDKEVIKYSSPGNENWGKVAKRLYNIFRITNRHDPALFLRQLFDDPAARLYQVPAGLYAIGQAIGKSRLSGDVMQAQLDGMITTVRECYTKPDKDQLIQKLSGLLTLGDAERQAVIDEVTEKANQDVSDYFEATLKEDPEIVGYLTMITEDATSS